MSCLPEVPQGTTRQRYLSWREALASALLLVSTAAQPQEVQTISLAFELEALDLDSGIIYMEPIASDVSGSDIRIAFNALRTPGAVVMPVMEGVVELAFVSDVAFDGVTSESVSGLTFSSEPVDVPFGAADTVVVRTDSGAVFKLGNAAESGTGVTFNYAAL
jgi:hypothetical protein